MGKTEFLKDDKFALKCLMAMRGKSKRLEKVKDMFEALDQPDTMALGSSG